jgi:hypothetical protein
MTDTTTLLLDRILSDAPEGELIAFTDAVCGIVPPPLSNERLRAYARRNPPPQSFYDEPDATRDVAPDAGLAALQFAREHAALIREILGMAGIGGEALRYQRDPWGPLQYAGWTQGTSKSGHTKWTNESTGEVRYQDKEPGTRQPAQGAQVGDKLRPAAQAPDRSQQVAQALQSLNAKDVTPQHVDAVTDQLLSMSHGEILALGQSLGLQPSGLKDKVKGHLARALIAHASGKAPVHPEAVTMDEAAAKVKAFREKGEGEPRELVNMLIAMNIHQLRELRNQMGGQLGGRSREQVAQGLAAVRHPGQEVPLPEFQPKAQAGAGPAQTPATPAVAPPVQQKIQGFLDESNLAPEHKKAYGETISRVVSRMPAKAQAHLDRIVSKATFYGSTKELGEKMLTEALANPRLAAETRAKLKSRLMAMRRGESAPGGGFTSEGHLFLDGEAQYRQKGAYAEQNDVQRATYAHELGHGLDWVRLPDGRKTRLSTSSEWQDAFASEIGSGGEEENAPLTNYAKHDPQEAFAEFSRLLYGSEFPLEQIERDFPKASAFFKGQGYWPESKPEASAQAGKLSDVFSTKDRTVTDPQTGDHIDVLKPPAEVAARQSTAAPAGAAAPQPTPAQPVQGEPTGSGRRLANMTAEEKAQAWDRYADEEEANGNAEGARTNRAEAKRIRDAAQPVQGEPTGSGRRLANMTAEEKAQAWDRYADEEEANGNAEGARTNRAEAKRIRDAAQPVQGEPTGAVSPSLTLRDGGATPPGQAAPVQPTPKAIDAARAANADPAKVEALARQQAEAEGMSEPTRSHYLTAAARSKGTAQEGAAAPATQPAAQASATPPAPEKTSPTAPVTQPAPNAGALPPQSEAAHAGNVPPGIVPHLERAARESGATKDEIIALAQELAESDGAATVGRGQISRAAVLAKEGQRARPAPAEQPPTTQEPAATPEPAKPTPAGGAADLPPSVRGRVEWAIGRLADRHRSIEAAKETDRKFKGGGRYEQEVRDKLPEEKEAVERLKQFIDLAGKNGVDAHAIMQELGLTPEMLADHPDLAPSTTQGAAAAPVEATSPESGRATPAVAPSPAPTFEDMVKAARDWRYMAVKDEPDDDLAARAHGRLTTKSKLDDWLQKTYGIDAATARSISNRAGEDPGFEVGNNAVRWTGNEPEPTGENLQNLPWRKASAPAIPPARTAPLTADELEAESVKAGALGDRTAERELLTRAEKIRKEAAAKGVEPAKAPPKPKRSEELKRDAERSRADGRHKEAALLEGLAKEAQAKEAAAGKKATPAQPAEPSKQTPAGGKPQARPAAPAHPTEGKPVEQVKQALLAGNMAEQLRKTGKFDADQWKLAATPAPAPEVLNTIIGAVNEAKRKNSFDRPSMAKVFAAAKAAHPGLTLTQFQAGMLKLARDGKLRNDPFTQSVNTMPEDQLRAAFPLDGEIKNYVDTGADPTPYPVEKSQPAASPTPAAPRATDVPRNLAPPVSPPLGQPSGPKPMPTATPEQERSAGVPSGDELARGKVGRLGNESGNRSNMHTFTVNGREYVVKETQEPHGARAETESARLAQLVGHDVPPAREVRVPGWDKLRHGGIPSWGGPQVASDRVPGQVANWEKTPPTPRQQRFLADDAVFRWATGNEDVNEANYVIRPDGSMASIDHEPAFSSDDDFQPQNLYDGGAVTINGKPMGSISRPELPGDRPIPADFAAKVLSTRSDILAAARKVGGEPAAQRAGRRLDALQEAIARPGATFRDLQEAWQGKTGLGQPSGQSAGTANHPEVQAILDSGKHSHVRPENQAAMLQAMNDAANMSQEDLRRKIDGLNWTQSKKYRESDPEHRKAEVQRTGLVNVYNARLDQQRAVAKKDRAAEKKVNTAEAVKQIQEWQRAGKMPDGRQMAKAGDEVTMVRGGFGGMPTVIKGQVVQTPGGMLRVKITGGGDMLGIASVGVGKTVDWSPSWNVKGDQQQKGSQQQPSAPAAASPPAAGPAPVKPATAAQPAAAPHDAEARTFDALARVFAADGNDPHADGTVLARDVVRQLAQQGMTRDQASRVLAALADRNEVILQQNDHPSGLSEQERAELPVVNGKYITAVGARSGTPGHERLKQAIAGQRPGGTPAKAAPATPQARAKELGDAIVRLENKLRTQPSRAGFLNPAAAAGIRKELEQHRAELARLQGKAPQAAAPQPRPVVPAVEPIAFRGVGDDLQATAKQHGFIPNRLAGYAGGKTVPAGKGFIKRGPDGKWKTYTREQLEQLFPEDPNLQFSRRSRAMQYARLAESQEREGDYASAAIYRRQAEEAIS